MESIERVGGVISKPGVQSLHAIGFLFPFYAKNRSKDAHDSSKHGHGLVDDEFSVEKPIEENGR
jgi:hypothetical protein